MRSFRTAVLFLAAAVLFTGAASAVQTPPVIPSENTADAGEVDAQDIPGIDAAGPDETAPEDAAAIEPDKQSLENTDLYISSTMAAGEKSTFARLNVKEAEFLFSQSMNSIENGNSQRALELCSAALSRLAAAPFDEATLLSSRKEFEKLFTTLDHHLAEHSSTKAGQGQKYAIPMDTDNAVVQKYLRLYTKGEAKETIEKALARSGRYRDMIHSILREYDLPDELIYLPVVESLYKINDRSRAGALGLWQLMPDRARALGLKVNYWIDERKDPEKSTRAAARYLKELHLMFNDWHLALAAYNRGEYGLVRDLKFSKATNIEQIANRNAVPKETELYVPKFIACVLIGDNYREYGLDPAFEKPVPCDIVTTDNIVDLSVAARCAGTDADTLQEFNPALTAWCTPHNYPAFELHLPAGSKAAYLENIAKVKPEDLCPRQAMVRYKIRKGDTLGRIAKKFNTTSAAIRTDNHLKTTHLKIGKTLVIRPGTRYYAKKTTARRKHK